MTLAASLKSRPAENISIHIPRGGDDFTDSQAPSKFPLFQSTSPVGGMTQIMGSPTGRAGISIHIPRGGDDCAIQDARRTAPISIHIPRGGDDGKPSES